MNFTWRGALRGARASLAICFSDIAFGLVFGVLAGRTGLSLAEACLMSAVVNAGSSQYVALTMWSNPIPLVPIVLTTLLINVRHVLLGLTLQPWFARLPARLAYPSYFFMSDESWALTLVEARRSSFDRAFMLGAGAALTLSWVGFTAVGWIAGSAIANPASVGLDFAYVAVFVALLVSLARGRPSSLMLPWIPAAAVAIASHQLLPGTWYILLGAAAGAVTGLFLRPSHA
jgi:4-azaleucine resistance transporter AzlC